MALGISLVAAPANAALVAPASGSVLRGNFTFEGSALGDGTACVSGEQSGHTFSLINSSGTTVLALPKINGTGVITSQVIDSHVYPNGSYTARTVERRRTGFLFCGGNNTTVNNPVTIDNITEIAFNSPPDSGAQNTSVSVSATLTDPNLGTSVLPGRSVTFSLGGGASVSATTNAQGVATASLPLNGAPRTTTISASFAQTEFYKGSAVSRSFVVTKNSTSTTLVQPAPVVHGQSTSFTANVVSTNGLATAPSGTVQFTVDGNAFGTPVALVAGQATSLQTSSLSTGNHTIGAVYSGSGDHLGSTASTVTQVVDKAATTTSLTASPSPTVAGQAVTFTAHVDVVAPGVGTLAGGVQFNVDGEPFGTAVPLGAGDNATLTISNLSVANHDVVAVYNGNADFASSSSATLTHGVGKADTSLELSSSSNPAFSGAPITYTAVVAPVAPGAGTVTGTVQFAVDGDPLGAPVPVVGGQAVSPVANLQVPSHLITANYSGDANFAGQSDSLTQVVVAAQTTTTLTTSPNPSVFGQPVTLRAEVVPDAPATGSPTGFVQFIVDGANYAFVELDGQVAETPLTGLAVGAHSVRAVYLSNDMNFFTSSSTTVTQQVNKASTTTSVTSSSPTAVFGQPVTFTAQVAVTAPGAGSPSGTIVFKDGTTTIGTQPISSATGGQASITVSNLTVGQHAISATYSGDDSFNGSVGNAAQSVIRAQTSTLVASSANPSQSGQGVQFTATVSPVAPGAGDPGGTVRFFVNGAALGGPAPVVGGVATSTNFVSLTPGVYKISATYSGDGNFVGSTGLLDQGAGQNVTKGQTTMTVVSGPSPSAYGAPVTVTTTLSAMAPAQRTPSGVVQVWEGDELLGATSLAPAPGVNTAEATFVTTSLSAGTHTLTAVYVGNFNFEANTSTATQIVGQVPTVTGLESSANPAVFGDTVTFTATVDSATGTPTGTVVFREGSTVLGTAVLAANGGEQRASLAVPGLGAGTHAVTATYSGDVSHGASTSPPYTQVISKAPTTIVAADVNNPGPLAPRQGWIRAKLTDRYGNPMQGRSISFDAPAGQSRPARHLCDAVTDAQGIAECDTQVVSIDLSLVPGDTLLDIHGTYDVTYVGDADTIGSTARGHEY